MSQSEIIVMRHIYKHVIIGFILASFTFSPTAFAAPGQMTKREKGVNNVIKVIKSSKKGVKMSNMVEAFKPLLKTRVYRTVVKDSLPFWDKKFSKVIVGKDYVKLTYNGRTMFARYVDRGPIAFIVNNKPLLWKDFLTFEKAKNRLSEILVGHSIKKVSFLEKFMSYFSYTAYAKDEEDCLQLGRSYNDGRCGTCLDGFQLLPEMTEEALLERQGAHCERTPATVEEEEPVISPVDEVPPPQQEDEFNWMPLLIVGGMLLLFLLLSRKKKGGGDGDDDPEPVDPDPPIVGWTPEGSCPTPGARGLTEADLPPQCRQSSCGSSGTCAPSSGGSIDGEQSAPSGY